MFVAVCVYMCEQTRKNTYQILNVTSKVGRKGALLTFFLHIYILIDLHSEEIILKKYFLKDPKEYRFLQAQGRIPYMKIQNIKIYLFYNG